MAILSNVNGKFAVDSTGAIQFSGSAGTSGYILRSNGNAAPTWVDSSTVIGGPYLPLTGGTLSGALAGTSATFSGNVAIGPDALDIQIKAASNNSGNNLIYMRGNASNDKSSLQINHFGYADYYIGVGHVGNGKFNIANDLTGNDFVIDTSGNVGIGVTGPNAKLKVEGNAATNGLSIKSAGNGGTYPFMVTWSGGNEGDVFCINDSLNVGIGTTSPSEILQTNKNSAGNIVGGYFTNSQANTGAESVSLAFGLNRSGGDFVRQVKAITFGAEQQWTGTPSTVDGYLSFSTVSNETVSERMRIDSSGLVKFSKTATTATAVASINHASNDFLYINGGTAGASFGDDDQNTRMICYNNDYIRFDSVGVERMRLTPDGNSTFLILKPKPATYNSKSFITLYGTNSSTYGGSVIARSSISSETDGSAYGANLKFYTNDSSNVEQTRFQISSNGFGYYYNRFYLVSAANQGDLFFGTSDNQYNIFGGGTYGYMGYNTGGYHRFLTSGTERMRITSTRVTINNKPNSGLGYAVLIDVGTGATGDVGYQTLSQLNTNLAGASDIRFKKNIKIIPNAIEKIKTINGYTFDWDSENEDYNYSEKEGRDAGIIAQEIQKVLPEIVQIATVDRDEEGKSTSGKNYLSVNYKKIIPLLIQGIKEQETSIQELEARIKELENK